MPVFIDEMTSDVTALEGDLPLNAQQIEKLVQLVIAQLEKLEREKRNGREATKIRAHATPDM